MQLEIEKEALKKEKDDISKARINDINNNLSVLDIIESPPYSLYLFLN